MDIGKEQPARRYTPLKEPVPQRETVPRTVPQKAPVEAPVTAPVKVPQKAIALVKKMEVTA